MKNKKLFLVQCLVGVLLALFLYACDEEDPYPFLYETDDDITTLVMENTPEYPAVRFAVFSDPHYFSPDLLVSPGSAFDDYLDHDRKMIEEGPEILGETVSAINDIPDDVDFVIIPGDLTKDGEYASHEEFREALQPLLDANIKVFVVPGNHDINNPQSNSYDGENITPVATITRGDFETIYQDCGYSAPLYRDPNSLSYIVEPIPGLWIFALDSCRDRENIAGDHSVTGGTFYPFVLTWLEQKLIQAIEEEKAVIGFQHHGMLEHYPANEKHYSDYLLNDFQYISEMMAAYGMRFVFTGHFHAQDITQKSWPDTGIPNHFLCDIETGSLVTYPVPWRLIEIDAITQQMTVSSNHVESIPSQPVDFSTYARDYAKAGTILLANEALTGYGVSVEDQERLSPQIAEAYLTHLAGDEVVPDPVIDKSGLSLMGHIVLMVQGDLIEGWYNDIPPVDNYIVIDLEKGPVLP